MTHTQGETKAGRINRKCTLLRNVALVSLFATIEN